jgi:membrane-associated phospholipid phosphatase
VVSDFLKSIDKGAYYAFSEAVNGATGEPQDVVQLLESGTWVGSYYGAVLLLALACILLLAQRRARAMLFTVAAIVIAAAGVEVMRIAVPIHRPENAARILSGSEMQHSFPASEVFAFTLAGAIFLYAALGSLRGRAARIGVSTVVAVLVLWVAMSELLLVLHFVTDVAAGLFGGLAVALLITRVTPRLDSSPAGRAAPTAG